MELARDVLERREEEHECEAEVPPDRGDADTPTSDQRGEVSHGMSGIPSRPR